MNGDSRTGTEYGRSKGLFGETDRESGEYHFRSGYTQQVYSNAHFVPVEESTTTPKYYRPADRTATRSAEKKKRRRKSGAGAFAAILLLCLLTGLLGGVAGGFLALRYLPIRPEEDKAALDALSSAAEETVVADEAYYAAAPEEEEAEEVHRLSAAEVYTIACNQTVSVSVEIVTYDRYGNQIPSVISGSGIILSGDGYILTNYHVVEDAVNNSLNVTVMLYDGSVAIGRIVGAAEDEDLAIVKIDREGLSAAVLGNSDSLQVGDEIFAVGNPYGMLEFTMTVGHVSALERTIATEETENAMKMFQIDAAVYSGNSGGPVYNTSGEVVGIVTAKYNSSGMEGIGFALPISEAIPAVSELMEKGYVSGKAALGVSFDSRYNSVYSRYYRLPDGAFVSSVVSGSCAEHAGISPGDILIQIGEYGIEDYEDVPSALRHYSAGDAVNVRLYRDGQVFSVLVTLDESIPSVAFGASSLSSHTQSEIINP